MVEAFQDFGDTLHIGEKRIRLWGIDAPELSNDGGLAAKEGLNKHIGGHAITCWQKDTDRYGRIVAQCFFDGEDVAEWLILNGHARDWPKYSGGYYAR